MTLNMDKKGIFFYEDQLEYFRKMIKVNKTQFC